MRVRKLDANGDYSFGNGLNDFYINVPEAVGQVVGTSFLLFLGEWFLDITIGTPIVQGILGKHSKDDADFTIRRRISQAQGVTGISSYSSSIDADTRTMGAIAAIDTVYGPTTVDVKNQVLF